MNYPDKIILKLDTDFLEVREIFGRNNISNYSSFLQLVVRTALSVCRELTEEEMTTEIAKAKYKVTLSEYYREGVSEYDDICLETGEWLGNRVLEKFFEIGLVDDTKIDYCGYADVPYYVDAIYLDGMIILINNEVNRVGLSIPD